MCGGGCPPSFQLLPESEGARRNVRVLTSADRTQTHRNDLVETTFLLHKSFSILDRVEKRLHHLRVDEVAIEVVEFVQPEIVAVKV